MPKEKFIILKPIQDKPKVSKKKEGGINDYKEEVPTYKERVIVTRSNGEIEDDWELMSVGDGKAVVEKEDISSGERIRKVIPENELRFVKDKNKNPEVLKYIEDAKNTVACSSCGRIQEATAVFCGSCGKPMNKTEEPVKKETVSVFCPFCGKEQNNEAVFCGFCGEKIPGLENTNEEVDSPDAGELMDKALKNINRITSKEKEVKLTDVEFNQMLEEDAEKWKDDIKTFKLDLEKLLPPEFNNLTPIQKQKVLQDSKKRIVDIVKADAQTQYSEELKKRMQENIGAKWKYQGKIMTGIRNIKTSIKSSFTKERDIKNTENETYLKIINSEEGKKLITEDLQRLVEIVGKQKVHLNYKGEMYVNYLNVYSEIPDNERTEEQEKIYSDFNIRAGKFSNMPYEWGQEKEKKYWGNRKKYEEAKAEYEHARNEVLKIKSELKGNEIALIEMLKADNSIKLEQLLNTHPEFEKALDDFTKTAGWREKLKSIGSAANTLSGKNMINRGLVLGGAGIRAGAKILPWIAGAGAGVATLSTAIATPIAGGVIGFYRGKFKAKETLQERQKGARYGQKDESTEKVATADATRLATRLENLVNEINLLDGEQKAKKLANLAVRIEHSIGKIEKGQVNFGNAKSSLVNQFNLVNALNQAVALKELNSSDTHIEVKNRIENLLKNVGENVAENTSRAQKSFVKKQAWKGALIGGGLAGIGYGVRYLAEHMSLSGGNNSIISKTIETKTPKNIPNKPGSFIPREEWMKDPFGKSAPRNIDTPTGTGKTYVPDELRQAEEQARIEREAFKGSGTSPEKGNVATTEGNPVEPLDPASKKTDAQLAEDSLGKENSTTDITNTTTENKTPIASTVPETSKSIDNFVNKGITIERGGAIKAIKNLQDQLKIENPDITKAPKNIQDFVNADPTKKAIELGFYDPTKKAESALVQKGSVLKFDSTGKLLFGKPDADGNIAELGDKYTGKMLDSDRPKIIEERPRVRRIRQNVIPKNIENVKIQKSTDTIDLPQSKPSDNITLRPENKIPETPKDIDVNTIVKEQAPAVAADAPVTDAKPTPAPKISPTPEEQKIKIETQMDLIEEYPELKGSPFIKNPPSGMSGAKIVEITKLYNENVAKLSGNDPENWSYVKDVPTKNFLGQKVVQGDKMVPYLNKLKEISGLNPEYNVIDGDESIEKYMVRVHEWAVKNNKLGEVKNIKIEQ